MEKYRLAQLRRNVVIVLRNGNLGFLHSEVGFQLIVLPQLQTPRPDVSLYT